MRQHWPEHRRQWRLREINWKMQSLWIKQLKTNWLVQKNSTPSRQAKIDETKSALDKERTEKNVPALEQGLADAKANVEEKKSSRWNKSQSRCRSSWKSMQLKKLLTKQTRLIKKKLLNCNKTKLFAKSSFLLNTQNMTLTTTIGSRIIKMSSWNCNLKLTGMHTHKHPLGTNKDKVDLENPHISST